MKSGGELLPHEFPVPSRNVAKMEDAEVTIDDGKDDSVVPDTLYQ